ncbi:uncharacterized protein N7483_007928 [Penicillium malachiteum]|uniref:uncharacterized protein n=1 Tax=Penicillium malachiteum TaxID=1324776 RepID=UPI002549AD56|nr:uncharacterized protein N7483_007928 [Penicillium malachiteum]KAJ5726571.1 hypothetical protein N7483_007928 [Penicillium malachiteum]
MLKILRDHFKRNNSDIDESLPPVIRAMIVHLKDQRQPKWLEYPEARQAQQEASQTQRYHDVGYTTDFSEGDEDGHFLEGDEDDHCSDGTGNSNEDYND